MELLVWIGAGVTCLGLLGIVWSGIAAGRAKRDSADDAALKAALGRLVALNYGALAVAALGLMCVILGVILS